MDNAEGKITSGGLLPSVEAKLVYKFIGNDADKAGYAEGIITLMAPAGTYYLYWSDDERALDGYYEIAKLEVGIDKLEATFKFGYHTAIPANATRVIAAPDKCEGLNVCDAIAVFDIPEEKQLGYKSDDAIYTFNSYSDIHIDEERWGETPAHWFEYSESHWAEALAYSAKMKADFIVTSGDQVTNAKYENLDKEWKVYHYILAQSDYVNPIYESCGNHEIRKDEAVQEQLATFIINSGLDSNIETIQKNKPYYSFIEPCTGDLFIVMALERGYRPAAYDEFTREQMDWVEALLRENYGRGRNIFIIQHALISGYGPGDDYETPYYRGSIAVASESVARFKGILENYKDIIWISGHSHEAFSLEYNYTNCNGSACNMIHNSSIGGPTHVTDGVIDYAFEENLSQGYFVQTYEKSIIFSGANVCEQKIYPAHSYIIDGNTKKIEKKNEQGRTDLKVTAGNVRSAISNVYSVLGIYYEYSSYNQYQHLKKIYYKYKDKDIDILTAEERSIVYDHISNGIEKLHSIVSSMSEKVKQ